MSLPKLASLLGISRNQLSKLFNVHKKTSFYDYLNNLRFNESLRLLNAENNKFSIADIAIRSGFNSRNSFYTVFMKKTGVTPTLYRKQFKQGSHTETIEQ